MNLVVIQSALEPEHYLSAEAFKHSVLSITENAVDGLEDLPTLVAFPELIGFPLIFTLGQPELLKKASLRAVAKAVIKRRWRDALKASWQYKRLSVASLFLPGAIPAYLAYKNAFAEVARQFGITVVAGSSFLPVIEEEPSKGVYIADARLHNTALSFSVKGQLLSKAKKVFLTPGLESTLGFTKGTQAELLPFHSPVGKIGVAICLDGFYSSVINHFDAQATDILVQPSANMTSWTRAWPADESLSEGEAWVKHGLAAQLQTCQHIRYGLNPMMVGELWGLAAEGRSSIVANTSLTERDEAFLAVAESSKEPEILQVHV